MDTDKHGLIHQVLTERIIKVFYDVYNELGHGFLESVYEGAMEIALQEAGLEVQRQVRLKVTFRGRDVGEFVADLLVNGAVFVELKAVSALDSAHTAQALNQLRASPIEVGLLMNFGQRAEFKRLLFTNDRKPNLQQTA
jgi:GxxExxY protein